MNSVSKEIIRIHIFKSRNKLIIKFHLLIYAVVSLATDRERKEPSTLVTEVNFLPLKPYLPYQHGMGS
jgi:hypothetical protein